MFESDFDTRSFLSFCVGSVDPFPLAWLGAHSQCDRFDYVYSSLAPKSNLRHRLYCVPPTPPFEQWEQSKSGQGGRSLSTFGLANILPSIGNIKFSVCRHTPLGWPMLGQVLAVLSLVLRRKLLGWRPWRGTLLTPHPPPSTSRS